MKIVFSRKGFDSAAGGCPSPIINGVPVSLPIPTKMPSIDRYSDLPGDLASLVSDLTNGRITGDSYCHLDPDIDSKQKPRPSGWRGALGQVSAAASHLNNQGIAPGDLFLFWGLFQPVEHSTKWRFSGLKEHRIFGWLQVDSIVKVGCGPAPILRNYPWLKGHPHLEPGWDQTNTLFVAKERLDIDGVSGNLAGYGAFGSGYRLTAQKSKLPSLWEVPEWLNPALGGVGMSYNPVNRWSEDGTLKSAARGQEFVADIGRREEVIPWLSKLFEISA
jgi:hypothetical protein